MIWSPLRACISIRVDLIAYRDKVERDPGYAVITMEVVVRGHTTQTIPAKATMIARLRK